MGKLRCPICRSRQWRKEPSSGMLVCSEGHILQSYRNETTEMTDMVGHVLRQRKVKTVKPVAGRRRANPAYYHGTRARLLYFQSLQLLLRLQISALQTLWELPPEFEAVCRDVWALHLTTLREPITTEELGGEAPSGEDPSPERAEALIDADVAYCSDSDQPPHFSDDEKAEIEVEPRNDLADLLDGLSDDCDDSGEDEVQYSPENRKLPANDGKPRRDRLATMYTLPSSTVAVLMTACWIIRLPVLYMDLVRLINDYSLPYLDIVSRGLIPRSMVVHMNTALVRSLNVHLPPRPLQLHRLSSQLGRRLMDTYKVAVPEANAPHILCRAVEALHLPVVFYHMTKIFADSLRISLTLHPSLSAPAVNPSGKSLPVQLGDNIPVEMALVCTVVLLVKLIYGLDGRPRGEPSETELLPELPSQDEFLSRLRGDDQQALETENKTAMELSPVDMDRYLNFCTRALLGQDARSQDALLERMFPLLAIPSAGKGMPWPSPATDTLNMPIPPPLADPQQAESLPRGMKHGVHSTNDVLGELPEDYGLVVSQAARWCGVKNDDIALIVERFERRLLRDLERRPKPSMKRRDKDSYDEDLD